MPKVIFIKDFPYTPSRKNAVTRIYRRERGEEQAVNTECANLAFAAGALLEGCYTPPEDSTISAAETNNDFQDAIDAAFADDEPKAKPKTKKVSAKAGEKAAAGKSADKSAAAD